MTIPERMTELEKKMSKLWDAVEEMKRGFREHSLSGDATEASESPSIFGTPQHLIPEGAVELVSDGYRALRFKDSDGDIQEVKILSAYTWAHVGHGVTVTVDMMHPDDTESTAYPWLRYWLSHFSEPMPGACDHQWVSGDNEVVSNSAVCLKCKTIVAADTVKLSEPMPGGVEEPELEPNQVRIRGKVLTLFWDDGERRYECGGATYRWEVGGLGESNRKGDAWFEANKPDPAPKCTRCGDTGKVDVESMSRNGWSEPCPDCADEPNPSPSTAPLTDEGG